MPKPTRKILNKTAVILKIQRFLQFLIHTSHSLFKDSTFSFKINFFISG
ncbi:hypothetical protein J6P52_06875 [bacterium]|nr:hypothetical protein [bacterium]MBO6094892.1 hypothetical protein [bacterium]